VLKQRVQALRPAAAIMREREPKPGLVAKLRLELALLGLERGEQPQVDIDLGEGVRLPV
jgi:hypothetical protein